MRGLERYLIRLIGKKLQIMAEVVADDGVSTYNAFESLADAYISGTDDMRAGIDKTLSLLTGYYMPELAEYIICREGE